MKLRRIVAGVMAATMAVTFVACSSSSSTSSTTSSSSSSSSSSDDDEESTERELVGNTYVGEGLPLVEEAEVYTIYYGSNAVDYSGDQNDKPINQILSDGTNVTIEWTANSSDYGTQMNLQIAAGQGMYDAYMGWNNETTIVTNTSRFYEVTEEALIDYGFYIYEGIMENCEDGLDAIKKSDGKIWVLPGGIWSAESNQLGNVMFINTEWLDAVGEDMPTTMEEFYDVCVKFLEEDPNGNGTADEIPVLINNASTEQNIWTMAGAWGLYGENGTAQNYYMNVVDGEVIPMVDTENFYDFLVAMNEWYDAGLIYAEVFTCTTATANALVSEGVQGCFNTWSLTEEQSLIYEPIPVLSTEGYEGEEMHSGNLNKITANMNCFAISSTCENPTGLLAWWNLAHQDVETKVIANYAEEGMMWEYNDDGSLALVTLADEELPTGITSSTSYNFSYAWRVHCPISFDGEYPTADVTDTYGEGQRLQWFDLYEDYISDEALPKNAASAEALEAISLTQTEVEDLVDAFIASSIVNGIDEDSWADYLSDLESVNFDAYIQFYQDWCDGVA